jgi:hypothetical protein
MLKLNSADPRTELLQILRQQNPKFPDTTIDNLLIVSVGAGTTKNSKLKFYLKAAAGASGMAEVEYDRHNLGSYQNKFGSAYKTPVVNMFGTAGDVTNTGTVMQQLKDALGIAFDTTAHPDLQSTGFTVPAKGAMVDVAILPASSSLRFVTGVAGNTNTNLNIKLCNKGSNIGNKLTVRKINPFLRSNGTLNWTLDTTSTPANAWDRYTDVLLAMIDFSDLFKGHPSGSGLFSSVGLKQFKFLPAVMAKVNAKLAAVGITKQYSQSDAYHLTWVLLSGVQYYPDSFWTYAEGAFYTNTTTYRLYSTSGAAIRTKPTRIAPGFSHVLKVMYPGKADTSIPFADTAATDSMLPSQRWWLFQYNA